MMNILLLQLEFPTWKTARAWTYSAGYALADGLLANGVTCRTVPIFPDVAPSPSQSWIGNAQRLLKGETFDQVWVWMVHSKLDPEVWDWISGLAPVRVAFVMESLRYSDEDYQWAPHLRTRRDEFTDRLDYFTHALLVDERDADDLSRSQRKPVLWFPGLVPHRFVAPPSSSPRYDQAVFHGVPYGRRSDWLADLRLNGRLTFVKSSNTPTEAQYRFDHLQATAQDRLLRRPLVTEQEMAAYVIALQAIREGEFREWLSGLSDWRAIVNLPGLTQCYGGRVYEAMAVGRPVISWRIPHRPKTAALFEDGEEILLFDPQNPGQLADQIDRVRGDRRYADMIGLRGRKKLLAHHTGEHRLMQVLRWIDSGATPNYGTGSVPGSFGSPISTPSTRPTSMIDLASGEGRMTVSQTCAEEKPGAPVRTQSVSSNPLQGESMSTSRDERTPVNTRPPAAPPAVVSKTQREQDEFYINMFVKSPGWSTPEPNPDEAARWARIASLLEHIVRRARADGSEGSLRLLEVGCGRGWLTNLATTYGEAEGIEPVAGVVAYAKQLFPHLRFEAATMDAVLQRADFSPYDVVLCSEVIEHIPHEGKAEFFRQIGRMLKPGGFLVLTTPRAEMWSRWKEIAPPCQPIEDWVSEPQVHALLKAQRFLPLSCERIFVDPKNFQYYPAATPYDIRRHDLLSIYQVWAAQFLPTVDIVSAAPFQHAPMVSVIVPTYNRPERLRTALTSLSQQRFQDFEVIVVNDGTDSVEAVVQEMNRCGRITLINHARNRGLAAARNTGLRVAQGKYIAYLDDDDRFLPQHLETLVTALQCGTHKVAYTDAWRVHERLQGEHYVVTEKDLPYSHDFNLGELLTLNKFPVLCVMHERQCLEDVGYFDESLFAHEDWDLWIRMAVRYPFQHIKETTAEFTWRKDGSSMSSNTREIFRRTMALVYRKYRSYAERIPGVLHAQGDMIRTLSAAPSAHRFECSIIVPVWNNTVLTQQCLTKLAEVTDGTTYEVIVVDNGSTDGVQDFLRTLGGDVQVIRNETNLGFAKACNQGAKAARGKYVVFLNNDTIPLKGWLSALVGEVNAHEDVAVVGSKLLYEDGTIQHAGVVFSRDDGFPYHIYSGSGGDALPTTRRRELQCVTGACMLVRREVFDAVGGFDEGYQNGFEDVDLCLKIREQNGKVVYQPQSRLYHLESRTPGRKTHERANADRLKARWRHAWWLPDADRCYFEDGYAVQTSLKDRRYCDRVLPLTNDLQRSQYALVAEVQMMAQRRDGTLLTPYLTRVDEWPADVWVLRWGARLCSQVEQPSSAIGFWTRVLSLQEDGQARLALAKHDLEAGRIQDATTHLSVLLKQEPSNGEGWLLRGVLAMQHSEFTQAESAFEKAQLHGADQRKVGLGLIMAAMGAGKPERAWQEAVTLGEQTPDDEESMHWLLRAGTALERWDAVAQRLSIFVARNPAHMAMRFALAGTLLRANRYTEAQRECDRLRALDPGFDGLEQLAQQIAAAGAKPRASHAA